MLGPEPIRDLHEEPALIASRLVFELPGKPRIVGDDVGQPRRHDPDGLVFPLFSADSDSSLYSSR